MLRKYSKPATAFLAAGYMMVVMPAGLDDRWYEILDAKVGIVPLVGLTVPLLGLSLWAWWDDWIKALEC